MCSPKHVPGFSIKSLSTRSNFASKYDKILFSPQREKLLRHTPLKYPSHTFVTLLLRFVRELFPFFSSSPSYM